MRSQLPFRSVWSAALLLAGMTLLPISAPFASGKSFPEPSLVPDKAYWTLDFKHALPKRIAVAIPGKSPEAFWYLTYTVTNNTGREVEFAPQFEMVTNDGKIHPSDRNIPLVVFQAIKRREGNTLLLPAARIAGPLHQGEDQAKDGVAIWPEPMARMGEFNIFAGGLSNEFVDLTDDAGKPMKDADGHPIILRKTLELTFVIWGDELKPGLDEVHAKPQHWVMR